MTIFRNTLTFKVSCPGVVQVLTDIISVLWMRMGNRNDCGIMFHIHPLRRWMNDFWFHFLSAVFQSFQDDGKVMRLSAMKPCL